MKKYLLFFGIIVIVLGVFFGFFYESSDDIPISVGNKVYSGNVVSNPATDITYENLAGFLSRNAVIKDLPEDSSVLLKFYNFDSGSREWEKSFVLTKGNVEEGSVDIPDLTIYLHSKYLDGWNSRNFCNIMSEANRNGDLGYETSLSSVKFAWKFKSMNKHKSCFGF